MFIVEDMACPVLQIVAFKGLALKKMKTLINEYTNIYNLLEQGSWIALHVAAENGGDGIFKGTEDVMTIKFPWEARDKRDNISTKASKWMIFKSHFSFKKSWEAINQPHTKWISILYMCYWNNERVQQIVSSLGNSFQTVTNINNFVRKKNPKEINIILTSKILPYYSKQIKSCDRVWPDRPVPQEYSFKGKKETSKVLIYMIISSRLRIHYTIINKNK